MGTGNPRRKLSTINLAEIDGEDRRAILNSRWVGFGFVFDGSLAYRGAVFHRGFRRSFGHFAPRYSP
jgi:hypothetical protein